MSQSGCNMHEKEIIWDKIMNNDNTEGQYNLPSFSDWWENNKEDYASFWKSRREERDDGLDAYNRLKSTYQPILKNLQDQYNELTPATTVNEYRPESD